MKDRHVKIKKTGGWTNWLEQGKVKGVSARVSPTGGRDRGRGGYMKNVGYAEHGLTGHCTKKETGQNRIGKNVGNSGKRRGVKRREERRQAGQEKSGRN